MIDGNNPKSIKLYVSRWGGNDNNDGLTENTPLRTIQAAVNKIPKFNIGTRIIKIAPGEYEEDVTIEDFIGGKISLEAIDKHYKPVINNIYCRRCSKLHLYYLSTSSKLREGLNVQNCESVQFTNLLLQSHGYGAGISSCPHVEIGWSETTSDICGINFIDSTAIVRGTTINKADTGILATRSLVFSEGNTIDAKDKYRTNTAQIIE